MEPIGANRDVAHRTTAARWEVLGLLCAALFLRLAVAWAPFEWLLGHTLTDDTFYYLTIARNAVEGAGFTFDGIAPTNGFHPLWMALILPIVRAIPDDIAIVHGVLTLSAILDTLSVYLLYRICLDLTSRPFVARTTAALYACTPLLLSNAGPMNGLETACNVASLLLLLRVHIMLLGRHDLSLRDVLAYGVVTGLALLARTDNIVLVVLLYLHGLLIGRRGRLFGSLAVASLLLLPWMLWSWSAVGTVFQTSGVSIGYFARRSFEAMGWGTMDYAVQFAKNLAAVLWYAPIAHAPIVTVPLLGAATVVSVVARLRTIPVPVQRELPLDRRRGLLLVLVASIVLFLLVQTARLGYMRSWYYLSTLPAAMILFSVLIDDGLCVLERLRPRRLPVVRGGVVVIAVVAVAVGVAARWGGGTGETEKYLVARALNSRIPSGARIGAWNSGLYGFFFHRGTVVNLDGVANNRVYPHIRSGTVGRYCRSLGIGYLVDDHGTLRAWAPYWGGDSVDLLRRIEPIYLRAVPWRDDTIVVGRLHR